MSPASVQAAVSALLCLVGISYVLTRRAPRSTVEWLLVAVLAFLAIWTVGLALRFSAHTDAAARFALVVTYLGAQGLGPAWLLFALRFSRFRIDRRPGLAVAICAPSALFFLALVTNDGHRLVARSVRAVDLAQPPLHWAGPLFWVGLAWGLFLVGAGIAVFARYALRLYSRRGRLRGATLVAAGLIPTIASVTHYLDLVHYPADPTPLATVFAVGVAFYMTVRYRLLEVLPVARQEVIEQLHEAVLIGDSEGAVVDLNAQAERLLGELPGEILHARLSRALARLAPEDAGRAIERALEDNLDRGEPTTAVFRTRDGRELQIDARCVRDRDGEPTGQYAIVRDLTDARRYERLMRETQQRVIVGGLAAGIAHEVNNPLAFVASNLKQIHRVVSFSPAELETLPAKRAEELLELTEVVQETIEGVDRIAQIVGRIIRPNRVSEDDVVRLDVGRVVRDAVQLAEFNRRYSVPVDVGVVDGLPEVEGYPERLSQALLNLLLNAQHAAADQPGAEVRVDAHLDGSAVVLRFSLRSDARPLPGPTGDVGSEAELSAAYEIVREHGGTLESGGDTGALFLLRLPAQPMSVQAARM